MVQPRITDLTALFVCDRVSQYSQGWAHNLHPATSISPGLRFQVHTARGLLRLPMLKPLDQALREARVSMYSFHCNAKARLAGLERTLYSICSRQALPSDLRSSNEHHPRNTHTQSPAKLLLSAFLRCRFSPPAHGLEDTDHQSVVSRPVASASETAGVGPATNAYSGLATTAAACIPSPWSPECSGPWPAIRVADSQYSVVSCGTKKRPCGWKHGVWVLASSEQICQIDQKIQDVGRGMHGPTQISFGGMQKTRRPRVFPKRHFWVIMALSNSSFESSR